MRSSPPLSRLFLLPSVTMKSTITKCRGGFRGATRPGPRFFYLHFLEPYICPYANTCLKISSCIDLNSMCVQLLKYNLTILCSIISTLRSVAMLSRVFRPPHSKILDPPLKCFSNIHSHINRQNDMKGKFCCLRM